MSRFDFSEDEFADRRQKTRAAMEAAGLDWLVVIHPVAIRWLTGSDAKSYQEFQCLLISARPGPVAILTRSGEANEFRDDALVDEIHPYGGGEPDDPIEAFAFMARRYGLLSARVGLDVPGFYLHPHHYVRLKSLLGGALRAEVPSLVHSLSLVKSPRELDYIREASRLADLAMDRFFAAVAAGKSELELAGEVYHALLTTGSGLAASPINLVTGDRTCYSHGAPTDRRLVPGDNGNIEFGATFRRYTATIGRQFSLGEPTPRMHELHDLVRAASDACIAAIRPGVPAHVPHDAARAVIAAAGLDHGRVHLSGYGLAPGFPPSWAEPLYLFGGCTTPLAAGMVVTIEPPVFLGGERLGARIIDNVIITDDGCKLLSRCPRSLHVCPV